MCFQISNMRHLIGGFLFCILAVKTFANAPTIHLPIYRRGGRFARHELANITALTRTISQVEERYSRTYTDVDRNRIVRRWHDGLIYRDRHMLDEAGLQGLWYASSSGTTCFFPDQARYTKLQVGEPRQTLEIDLDMLSPDFYTIMTTSGQGLKYDTFSSNTHGMSGRVL